MLKIKTTHGEFAVKLVLNRYANNDNLMVALKEADSGAPFCNVSVNLGQMPENCICVDNHNCPALPAFLEENKIGKSFGISMCSGYCAYPVYELDMDYIKANLL